MRAWLSLSLIAFLLAGCIGGAGSDGPSPTTSASSPPKPLQVFEKKIDACPGPSGQPPVQTAAATGGFEIKPGHDQIIIQFHSSGEGQGGAEIRWVEEGTVVWSRPTGERISSAPTLCGGHAHSGQGVTKDVEPGNYTVRISYAGAVSIHVEVTARSTKSANATDHAGHSMAANV